MTLPHQPKRAVAAIVAAPSSVALGVPLRSQVDFDLLILTVSGHLSGVLEWSPRKVRVIVEWLRHLNENDDLVWPGNETLAAKAKVGLSTVKRAKSELRKLIGLFPLSNPETRGRGQFQYEGDRRGKLPTDTYELTPLAKMLPRAIWLKLVAAYRADKTARRAARAAAQDIRPSESQAARVDETGFPDPLSDPAPDSTHDVPLTSEGGNPAHSGPPVHAPASTPSNLCNVEIEIKSQKESESPGVPAVKNSKNATAATATESFHSPVLAPIREDGSRLPGYAAVRAFSPPMSLNRYRAIVKAFDDAWAEKVAWYVKWLPNCKPRNYAKTAVGVFNNWINEPDQHGWPGDFEVWLDRHQKDVQQRAELAAKARNAARVNVVSAPPKASTASVQADEPIPTAYLLRALDIERSGGRGRALHQRAKLTIESGPVKARARLLWCEAKGNDNA